MCVFTICSIGGSLTSSVSYAPGVVSTVAPGPGGAAGPKCTTPFILYLFLLKLCFNKLSLWIFVAKGKMELS